MSAPPPAVPQQPPAENRAAIFGRAGLLLAILAGPLLVCTQQYALPVWAAGVASAVVALVREPYGRRQALAALVCSVFTIAALAFFVLVVTRTAR